MDMNLKGLFVFTAIYGMLAIAALSIHPESASLRVADGIGNFEADAAGTIHLILANAE